ncbi:unnamed protein product [Eruca vesicaria subsp. sativa]|uniref:G3BP-like protein n=1 Tax=Eruca vesicaria subsp. sativa TaxID=29727 RepID=A0ABC8K0M8_ERUVS|nr:unnamed protein product [Eruca vesicaria subsp. sativa]
MAAEEGVVYDASQVSEAFVEKYYSIVGTMTHEACKFYADDSLVTRPGPDGTIMSFSSLEAIEKHYLSSYYDGTTIDVVSVDSQKSLGDGIFIMVSGFLTGKDNLKRKFIQAFYLARQKTVNQGYVVVNDIHRFVDEESSTTTTRSLPAAAVSEVAKPLEETKKTKQAHRARKKSGKADEVKKVVAPEKVVTAQKPKEPVPDTTVATPSLDGAKKSFASMVSFPSYRFDFLRKPSMPRLTNVGIQVLSMSRNAAPFQVKAAPVEKPSSLAQPKPHAAPAPEKKKDQKVVEEPGTSIFVSNLPMDARWPQVYELFKDFGPIKEYGVQIRSSKGSGRCFSFVAFESVASVQSVLKAAKRSQFKLGEHKLHVKEKQVFFDVRSEGGSMSQSASIDGNKTPSGSADGNKTPSGSADGSKTKEGSIGGEENDNFTLVRRRKSRRERSRQE